MRTLIVGLVIAVALGTAPLNAAADDVKIARTIVQKLRIQKELGNLKGFNIGVRVENGDVWMEGVVADANQRTAALEIARRVEGVKQVVNDLHFPSAAEMNATEPRQLAQPRSIMSNVGNAMKSALTRAASERPAPASPANSATETPMGTGLANTGPAPMRSQPAAHGMPVYRMASQMPVAYAPARSVHAARRPMMVAPASMAQPAAGAPMPAYVPGTGGGVAPARFDHPRMPGYAWPSYASHPNYAALTYPKQYSPTAWPYIGPFYPYPQVPLGWRKVTLEWDDGWWMLDFKSK